MTKQDWRTEWQWPWRYKTRTTEKTLLGLRRMQDRLQRCRVWVHNADEKYKPSLRE